MYHNHVCDFGGGGVFAREPALGSPSSTLLLRSGFNETGEDEKKTKERVP